MRFNNGELIKWRNIEKYSRILQKTERGIQPKTLFQLTTHLPELLFFMVLCHKILSVLEWYSRTSEDDNKGLKPENQGFTLPLQDQDDLVLSGCMPEKEEEQILQSAKHRRHQVPHWPAVACFSGAQCTVSININHSMMTFFC